MKKILSIAVTVLISASLMATSAGFTTVAETESQTLMGDIDLDGEIKVADAVQLQNYLLGRTTLTEEQWQNADIIADNSVDVFDMVAMRKLLLNPPPVVEENTYGWSKMEMGANYKLTAESRENIKIETYTIGEEPWWVQAKYEGIYLEAGKTYELSFTLSADREEKMNAMIQECPDPYTVYSLATYTATEEEVTYTQQFTMPSDCPNAKIAFDAGYGEGTYYIKDITLTEIGENLVVSPTAWSYYATPEEGAAAEFGSSDEYYGFKANVTSEGKYCWNVGAVSNHFTLNPGRKYRVSFEAMCSTDTVMNPAVQRTDGEYYYAALSDYVSVTGEMQEYSYEIDVNDQTYDNWYLCFNMAISEGEYTVQNIQIRDIGASEAIEIPSEYEYEVEQTNCSNGENNIFGYCYRPVTEEKVPLVIFSHCLGGTYKNTEPYAAALASNGYAVYIFDYCGGSPSSKSDGSIFEMSVLTEKSDLSAIIETAKTWDFVDTEKIVLAGESQGGMVTALTAEEYADEIAGTILLYPAFAIPEGVHQLFSTTDEIPESFVYLNKTIELGRKYAQDAWEIEPYELIGKNNTKPVMILHGDADVLVDKSYSERAAECYTDCELHIIENGMHGFSGTQLSEAKLYMLDYLEKLFS